MKLTDLFEMFSLPAIVQWAQHSCWVEIEHLNGDHDFFMKERLVKMLKRKDEKLALDLPSGALIKSLMFKARPPIMGDLWDEDNFDEYLSVDVESFILEDWRIIPQTAIQVEFKDDGWMRSFKGVGEALPNLEVIILGVRMQPITPAVGVLNLLKSKSLKHIQTLGTHSDEILKVVKIVNKHIPKRDVADCMDELIEAGLKDWAKI